MGIRYTQFTESFEWELVARAAYTTQLVAEGRAFVPISPKNFVVPGRLIMVGVRTQTPGAGKWVHGGWATVYSLQIPSSTTIFTANVKVANERLRLSAFSVIEVPYGTSSVRLEIAFPRYFRDAELEVWRYDGEILEI